VKRKRSRMVWDEARQAWVPRHGYKSAANELAKDWLIEDAPDREKGSDPFEERSVARKVKVLQNEDRRLTNAKKNARAKELAGVRAGAPSSVPAGIPAQLAVAEGHVSGLTG